MEKLTWNVIYHSVNEDRILKKNMGKEVNNNGLYYR